MKRLLGLFLSSLLSSLLIAACDKAPSVTPPPVPSTSQETFDINRGSKRVTVIVLAVDDAATPEAAKLRARIAQGVRSWMLHEVDLRWDGSCGNKDPAAWHPGDVRVILTRPSAPDSAALITPLDVPSLAWITKASTKEEAEVAAKSTAEALEKRLAAAGEPYRPLHAMKRALELVTRARAPENDDEAALVASLPEGVLTQAIIASERDDEDATSVGSLALAIDPTDKYDAILNIAVVGPFSANNEICYVDADGTSRLEAWGRQEDAHLTALPCDTNPDLQVLYSGGADCFTGCHEHALIKAPDGSADCRVFVDQPDLEQCHPERGHRDPDGKAELVDRQGKTLRRCEVTQLTGAALAGCRSSFSCPECQSGFCLTEAPELIHPEACMESEGEYEWQFRFTGEAVDSTGEWLHVVCNVEAKED